MTLVCNEHDMQKLLSEIKSGCLNEHDLTRIAELIPEDIRSKVWTRDPSLVEKLDEALVAYPSMHVTLTLQQPEGVHFTTNNIIVQAEEKRSFSSLVTSALVFCAEQRQTQLARLSRELSAVLIEKTMAQDGVRRLEAREAEIRAASASLK